MGFLDKLLSKLPLNGNKTWLGLLLLQLPVLLPQLAAPAQAALTAIGAAVTAVGALHKAIKGSLAK